MRGFFSLYVGIIILVISGVAYGAYFYGRYEGSKSAAQFPTISPFITITSDPKIQISPTLTPQIETYLNTENGYSISYSKDKVIRLLCPNEELILVKKGLINDDREDKPLTTCARDGMFDIEIKTYNYAIQDSSMPSTKDYKVQNEDLIISGQKAKKTIIEVTPECMGFCGPVWREDIVIFKGNKTYTFHLTNKELLPVFNEVLNTLKFL